MTARGLDASGPLWQFALALLLPFVFARLLRARSSAPRNRGRFIRADEAILLPVSLSLAFALLDFFPRWPFGYCLAAATAVVVAMRLAISRISRRPAAAARHPRKQSGHDTRLRRPALAFALSPLALLVQMQWIAVSRAAVLAAVWLVVTPPLLAGYTLAIIALAVTRFKKTAA